MAPGSIIKAAIFLIGWSMMLIALLESRMLSRVEQLQKEHHRDMEELRASAQGLHHAIPGHMRVQTAGPDKVAMMREAATAAERERRAPAQEGVPVPASPAVAAPSPPASKAALVEEAPRPSASASLAAEERVPAPGPPASPVPIGPEPPPATAEEEEAGPVLRLRPKSARPRKLAGFYAVGTSAAGVACFTFAGATTEVDMNSDNCRATGMICQGCFVATEDTNDKILEVVKCSTAKYKAGTAISGTSHMVEIMVMNTDADNTLTVKGCDDVACSTPTSTYTMNSGDSVVGFCYAGGSNKIYFPTMIFQNANTYNFNGKTIQDLGEVTTVAIVGGTITGTSITVGSGVTLDVSAGTLTLNNAQIAATKITGGVFTASQTYNFASSTIADLGTVTTADINGGTMDGVDVTVGSGKTLDVSAGTLTLGAGQIAADRITGGTFKTSQTYNFAGSTITDLGQVATIDLNGGNIDGATIATSDITVGSGKTLDVSAGTLTLNAGQVQAGTVGAGTFDAGAYSFSGSTISNAGEITTADINGGTIDGTNIGATTAGTGKFTTLKATGAWGITIGSTDAASTTTNNNQAGIVLSSTTNLGIAASESLTITCSHATASTPIVATAGPCTTGTAQLVNINPQSGGWTSVVKNIGTSACASAYSVFYLVVTSGA